MSGNIKIKKDDFVYQGGPILSLNRMQSIWKWLKDLQQYTGWEFYYTGSSAHVLNHFDGKNPFIYMKPQGYGDIDILTDKGPEIAKFFDDTPHFRDTECLGIKKHGNNYHGVFHFEYQKQVVQIDFLHCNPDNVDFRLFTTSSPLDDQILGIPGRVHKYLLCSLIKSVIVYYDENNNPFNKYTFSVDYGVRRAHNNYLEPVKEPYQYEDSLDEISYILGFDVEEVTSFLRAMNIIAKHNTPNKHEFLHYFDEYLRNDKNLTPHQRLVIDTLMKGIKSWQDQ